MFGKRRRMSAVDREIRQEKSRALRARGVAEFSSAYIRQQNDGSMSGYITFNVGDERVRVRSDGHGLYHVETGWSDMGTKKESGWVDYDTANRFIYENTK